MDTVYIAVPNKIIFEKSKKRPPIHLQRIVFWSTYSPTLDFLGQYIIVFTTKYILPSPVPPGIPSAVLQKVVPKRSLSTINIVFWQTRSSISRKFYFPNTNTQSPRANQLKRRRNMVYYQKQPQLPSF